MTETAPAIAPRQPRKILRIGLAALLALAIAGTGLLYGMRRGGKELANTECAPAQDIVRRIEPLARGQVAALTVAKSPHLLADIAFTGPDGSPRNLHDFRGRTVLLNLWATWCIPCREEMPALDRLQAGMGGKDFEVVAVSIDTARLEKRQAFLQEAGVKSLAFYADPTADVFQVLRKAGKVLGLPTSILIDSRGCELGVMAGQADWASDDARQLVAATIGKTGG